jgi:hypothetical protein
VVAFQHTSATAEAPERPERVVDWFVSLRLPPALAIEKVRPLSYHIRGEDRASQTLRQLMATQETDFNKETNRQRADLFIKDSHGITIDLTEVQWAQVLQSLLAHSDPNGPGELSAEWGERKADFLKQLLLPTAGELQDAEINSLRQWQSIRIENCTDVKISVRQFEVEKVVELGLAMLRLLDRQRDGQAPANDGTNAHLSDAEV